MIRLERTARPDILSRKAEGWTNAFVATRSVDPKHRPDSRQYAHREVREALRDMSRAKCFYCETQLAEADETVDHFVEVADDDSLAFEWTNLYLCCGGCQAKRTSVPRDDALDPCGDIEPYEHLTFDDELIRPLDGSTRGRATIRRYKLDRQDLDLRRMKQLQRLHKLVIELQALYADGLPDPQLERLRAFTQPESPYSLMFRHALQQLPPTR